MRSYVAGGSRNAGCPRCPGCTRGTEGAGRSCGPGCTEGAWEVVGVDRVLRHRSTDRSIGHRKTQIVKLGLCDGASGCMFGHVYGFRHRTVGMCYPCTHCNRCGREPKPGLCPICGYSNGQGAVSCKRCGTAFPRPPGQLRSDTRVGKRETRGESR